MILWLSFLSPQKQPTVQLQFYWYVLCFLVVACVLVFPAVYAASYGVLFLHAVIFCHLICLIPVLSRAVELPQFVLYSNYSHHNSLFIVWNFIKHNVFSPVVRLAIVQKC